MAVRRRFSAAFKRQVVEELLAGAATMAQVCQRYELYQTVVRSCASATRRRPDLRLKHSGPFPDLLL